MPSTRQLCSLLVAIAALTAAPPVAAQVTVDPRTAEFNPSPDHANATLVARYELEFYFQGASQPFQTANLGKPAPQGDGKIRVDLLTVLGAFPPAGAVYEARVSAVSQANGFGRSAVSNQFQFSTTCNVTISPTSTAVSAGASTGSIAVSAPAGCSWTASSGTSWITFTGTTSGSGNGTVSYSIAANTTTSPRTGAVSIAGQTFVVDQAAACAFTISPTSATWSASAATGTVAVTTTPACSWGVSNPVSWISITGTLPGSGSGTVNYAVAANPSTSQRSATLTVAGRAFVVNQSGVVCTPTLSATEVTVGASGGPGSVSVSVSNGCAWQTTNVPSWVTIQSGSGNGPGTVSYTVAANPSTSQRSGSMTIAGVTYSITQEGVACTYSISPTSSSVPAGASTGTVQVSAPTGCNWTAVSGSGFVTVTDGASGSGNDTVSYSIAANQTINQRNGSLTIAGHTFAITQAGAPCTLTLSPTSASVAAGATTGTFSVSVPTGCTWSPTNNAPSWITITDAGSGNGSDSVGYSVAANPSSTPRSGTIVIQGQTFTITQGGVPCTYQLAPTGTSVDASATGGTIAVTAPNGCQWTASSSAPTWVTATGGGSGTGVVTYSIAANQTITPRSASITIGTQSFSIVQAGIPCTYQLSPAGASIEATATTGTVTVTTLSGCTWSAISGAQWVSITNGQNRNGPGSITYNAQANTTTSPRTATLTIASQSFVLTQAGGPCNYSVSPATESVPDTGGNRSVTVTAQDGCAWSATSGASWITITSGGSGDGDGNIQYQVQANTSTSPRNGSIAVAGRVVAITQLGAPCSFNTSPGSVSLGSGTASGAVTVSTQNGCSWNTTNSTTWIHLTGNTSGTGSGSVNYSVDANPGATQRNAVVTIAGRPFTVTQAGVPCAFQISPTGTSIVAAATSGSVSVTTTNGCSWQTQSNVPWITASGGGTASGNATYNVAANPGTTPRTGTVTIAGQTFTINQEGAVCSFTVSPTVVALTSAASTFGVDVATPGACNWAASSSASWITLASGGGPGNGRASFNVAANTTGVQRSGTVTVAGQTVTVTQPGGSCTYTISPIIVTVSPDATTATVTVNTQNNCPWSASSQVPWVTFPNGSTGAGSGALTYAVQSNAAATQRSTILTIAGRSFSLTQQARICTYSFAPSSVSVSSAATSGTFTVTPSDACSWTPTSSATWLTVSGGGVGPGVVTYGVQPNTTGSTRFATARVGIAVFNVTQLAPCDYSISPTSVALSNGALNSSVSVSTAPGCTWTASSPVSWVTITGNSSGTGSGSVTYSVGANASNQFRSATLNIAGDAFTVNQSACEYTLSPAAISMSQSGGNTFALVRAGNGCGWTATADSSWITFPNGANGTGQGWLTLRASANGGDLRTGIVSVGSSSLQVNQSGTCQFSVSPGTVNVSGAGGQNSVQLTTGSACNWFASTLASWITINQGSTTGTGGRTVTFTVAPNTGTAARTGAIRVAGVLVTINQSGSGALTAPGGLRIIR
jgi:hypothetical protein